MLSEILPVYTRFSSLLICIVLGFLLGRFKPVSLKDLANLLVYLVTPLFVFLELFKGKLSFPSLVFTVMVTLSCVTSAILVYRLSGFFLRDTRANLLSLGTSTPNFGYFGVPVVIALYGDQLVAEFVMLTLGVAFSVFTYGFYIAARTEYTPRDSLRRLLHLPILYGALLALTLNYFRVPFPDFLVPLSLMSRGAYSMIGLLIIGIALGTVRTPEFDRRAIFCALLAKLLIMPAVFLLVVSTFMFLGCTLSDDHIRLFVIAAFMPLGTNTITISALFEGRSSLAAILVMGSTGICLLLLPFLAQLAEFIVGVVFG